MFELEGVWQYETQDTAPPGVGGLRTDDVATMWLHRIDANGYDRSIEFEVSQTPFDVLLRDSSGHSRRWTVSEMVDSGDYMTLQVAFVSGSVVEPNQNAEVLVQWLIGEASPEPPEPEVPGPTPSQIERISQAIIQKATRILMMAEAPLGTWGDVSEFGGATVRPDYAIRELLYGLHRTVAVDEALLAGLVTAEDVIRVGLQTDPTGFPTDRLPDVERALSAAVDWVLTNLQRSWGVG